MPAYYRTDHLVQVAPKFAGQTILNGQEIEDVVAFLLTLAILDDLGAIVVIALFYTDQLSVTSLGVAAVALAVLAVTGPLAVTSANRSGEPTPADGEGVLAVFGDAVAVYLLDEGPLAGTASTVVDLAHGEASILRAGTLEPSEVLAALRSA